jgi:hypothetical protein
MSVEVMIRVPNVLGQQLQQYRERLPEILERGLRELLAERSGDFQDENTIMQLLASQPQPDQVLAIRPSPALQSRVNDLLNKNRKGELSHQEEIELERYLMLEHLVRLAKAHAYQQVAKTA